MKVIEPIVINDATLISSTVPEDDAPSYASGVTYALGARVVFSHVVWESLAGGNVGHQPDVSPTFWVSVGPTNRWAVFDNSVSTQTTATGSIEFVVKPGRFDSIGLFGIDATSVRIRRANTSGTFFDKTFSMVSRAKNTSKWFDYFFGRFYFVDSIFLGDQIIDSSATLTITLTKPTGVVRVGGLVVGVSSEIGLPVHGVKAGIVDYSRKDVDVFGRTVFIKRAFAKTISVSLNVPFSRVDEVGVRLASLRATPALWVTRDNDYKILTVLGFYRDFSISVAYATHSICELNIEGIA